MTEEQKKLVEDNHNLIYWYCRYYNLSVEEYYDILAIGLCQACMTYDVNKGKFATYAHHCMRNQVLVYYRYNSIRFNLSTLTSLDAPCKDAEDIKLKDVIPDPVQNLDFNILMREVYNYLESNLSERDLFIFLNHLKGRRQVDIASDAGVSQRTVSGVVDKVQRKLREEFEYDT